MSRDSHGGWSDAAVCVFGVENWTKQSRPLKGVKALLQAMLIFQYQAYDFDLILLYIAYIKSSSFCFQMTIFDSTIYDLVYSFKMKQSRNIFSWVQCSLFVYTTRIYKQSCVFTVKKVVIFVSVCKYRHLQGY